MACHITWFGDKYSIIIFVYLGCCIVLYSVVLHSGIGPYVHFNNVLLLVFTFNTFKCHSIVIKLQFNVFVYLVLNSRSNEI